MKLDEKDKIILRELQKDAHQPIRDLSKKTGIPKTTLHHRVRRLEKEKVITKYVATVDAEKVGQPASAFVFGVIEQYDQKSTKPAIYNILKNLEKIPEVREAHMVTGAFDIIMRVTGKNEKEIGTVCSDKLREIPGLKRTESSIIFLTGKDTHEIKVE
tara:strand:+ start:1366 stop:1839 length:474 start_codon:yes stop_codon:yes gene_type:complete